jgi:hypothetical protein
MSGLLLLPRCVELFSGSREQQPCFRGLEVLVFFCQCWIFSWADCQHGKHEYKNVYYRALQRRNQGKDPNTGG